jgi:hypothetical protein
MHRTTVMLPDDLRRRAASHAQKAGMSLGELIREAIAGWLDRPENKRASDDPFFSDKTVFEGPCPADLSARHDDYLYGDENALR